ncbi:MAG: hypothetical protein IPP53_15290 [Bacteroidetes bacterium]|nr:hypothetical protein [Bacteroidota bacterium]
MSGGESVGIPRLLVPWLTNPQIGLFDEPFAGIDPIAVEDIQKSLVAKLKFKMLAS